MALADASAFLQLPAADIPATPPPDLATQRQILDKAADNLVSAIQKLPDFFARQTTTRFHDMKAPHLSRASAPAGVEHQAFQLLDSFSDTVYYRNGQEVAEPSANPATIMSTPRKGLVNWGVFGQLQRVVVTDIFKGKLAWSHWEPRASGPVAVFRYSISKQESNYVVNYCCFRLLNQAPRYFQSQPPFHGEIGIDPDTGMITRLVIITELSSSDPILQAEIAVEYEQMEIGGKMYVCPRKSITLTTAIEPMYSDSDCMNGVSWLGCNWFQTEKLKNTAINDTVYDSYHVFRSEARILPAEATVQEQKPPADSSAPSASKVQ
jgi:hypothetical protein